MIIRGLEVWSFWSSLSECIAPTYGSKKGAHTIVSNKDIEPYLLITLSQHRLIHGLLME